MISKTRTWEGCKSVLRNVIFRVHFVCLGLIYWLGLKKINQMKKLTLLFLICIAIVSCEKSQEVSEFHTSHQSGRAFLSDFAPNQQQFSNTTPAFTSANGNSYLLVSPFVSIATGDTLTGELSVELTEYLDKKEMMLANRPTLSYTPVSGPNGFVFEPRPIASAGAFELKTFIDGEPVFPKQLRFFFPDDSPNEEMQLFFGETTDSTFIWNPMPVTAGMPTSGWSPFAGNGGGFGEIGYNAFVNLNENFLDNGTILINCDYFFGSGLPLTNILIQPNTSETNSSASLEMWILFQDENAALSGNWNFLEEGFQFSNVPIGHQITTFSVGVSENQELYYGTDNFEIQENGIYTLEMMPVTEEELEGILDAL